jgi:hypothetical protein
MRGMCSTDVTPGHKRPDKPVGPCAAAEAGPDRLTAEAEADRGRDLCAPCAAAEAEAYTGRDPCAPCAAAEAEA